MDMELVDRIRFEKETKEQLAALNSRVAALERAAIPTDSELPAGDLEQVPNPDGESAPPAAE